MPGPRHLCVVAQVAEIASVFGPKLEVESKFASSFLTVLF